MDLVKRANGHALASPVRTGRARRRGLGDIEPVRRALPAQPTDGASIDAPFDMPAVSAPSFPDRVVDVRRHGAVADGVTDNTRAFAAAIAACARAGGGRVLIPKGDWLTGPIHLKSNIDLHLADGAVVRFSDDPLKYLPPVLVRWGGQDCYNFSPLIYARDCRNIAVTGRGTLIGQGKGWWSWQPRQKRAVERLYAMVLDGTDVAARVCAGADEQSLRPQFILPINCTNVLLEDFTVADGGPFWTVHVAYCRNVLVRRLRIDAPDGPNNDGIVIDSSGEVIVEDCELNTREDCVALKSGLNEDGWRVGRPTENVIVRRIRATGGRGGIAIGSEMSGGVRNVLVHDCHYDGVSAGVRIKSARGRGGAVHNVHVRDITIGRATDDAIQLTTEHKSFASPGGRPPDFGNIHIRNVTCREARTAVRMIGLPDAPLHDLLLENLTIAANEGLVCRSGKDIRLIDLHINPRTGPVLSMKDSQGVVVQGLNHVDGGRPFLDLRGRQTRDIRLRGESGSNGRPVVVLGIDVPKDALAHE